jgi:hypothetical protein
LFAEAAPGAAIIVALTALSAPTLRVTPAMAAGVTDRLFEVSGIVRLLEESGPKKAA